MGISQVSVVGLGLMGGSLCRSLKKTFPNVVIQGSDSRETFVRQAEEDGIIDRGFASYGEMIPSDGWHIFCTPLSVTKMLMSQASVQLKDMPGARFMDVGSVKKGVSLYAVQLGMAEVFIGCHPMAGSHRSGYNASFDSLYDNAPVFITPLEETPDSVVDEAQSFWRSIGACPEITSVEIHDMVTARTSHMPHLLSVLLYNSVKSATDDYGDSYHGSGFRDMTRLAAGEPSVWFDILADNRENILDSLEEMSGAIEGAKDLLRAENVGSLKPLLEKVSREKVEEE